MQALPAVGLPHPQQYVAALFKTAQLTTATDIYSYITNKIET